MSSPSRRHTLTVRVTHWLMTIAFFALLVTGIELVISHPRFYWGEVGNVNTPTLFSFHIPSSRATIPSGYEYVLPDQNGWSRYLHFQSAWFLLLIGAVYLTVGLARGHFRHNLLPARTDVSLKHLARSCIEHMRLKRPGPEETWSYNVLQRLAYLAVIFILFPLMIWTGLAMSPSFVSVFPGAVNILGGQQSARTLHFIATVLLTLFLLVHVFMVILAGFWGRMRAMITGRAAAEPVEHV